MRAGRLGKRLAVAVPTAAVTVATGVAINAAFVTGQGFIWPWVCAAAGLALVQVLMPGREAAPPPKPTAEPPAAGQLTWGEQERRDAIAARLQQDAVKNTCVPEMPVAWKAVLEGRDPGPGTPRVSGAEAVTELLLRSEKRRMVIIGEPGSGKTSLAWRMVRDMAARDDLAGLFPVVVPVGTWNPFEEGFDDWLRGCLPDIPGMSAPGLEVSEVLPILDGLDEYSAQLLGQALGILSNRYHSGRPLVLLSRPDPYLPAAWWCENAGAVTVELLPLPAAEIARYLEDLPRTILPVALDSVAGEIRRSPSGAVGRALSSPFMLDTFTRERAFYGNFLWEAESRDASGVEDLLASRFLEAQIRASDRWGTGTPEKWLAAVAGRANRQFAFRPNKLRLEVPTPVTACLVGVASAMPATAMLVGIRQLPVLLVVLLVLVLAGGCGLSLEIIGEYTSNSPTLDPRSELRIERDRAVGQAVAAAGITAVLGFLDVAAPYAGRWTLALGAVTGALLFLPPGGPVRPRLLSSAAGALPGLVLGWAAYSGTELGSFWRFAVPGGTVGALVFVAGFITGLVGHVSDGRGREGLVTAPAEAARASLPFGLLAGSVAAVAELSQLGFGAPLLNKVTGLMIFAAAVAGAAMLATVWTFTWAGYAYFALRGTFPLRLLAFLEEFSDLQVLRRVGHSYEFKHPALLRAARGARAESAVGW